MSLASPIQGVRDAVSSGHHRSRASSRSHKSHRSNHSHRGHRTNAIRQSRTHHAGPSSERIELPGQASSGAQPPSRQPHHVGGGYRSHRTAVSGSDARSHRSHRSHRSQRSHRSHRSGSKASHRSRRSKSSHMLRRPRSSTKVTPMSGTRHPVTDRLNLDSSRLRATTANSGLRTRRSGLHLDTGLRHELDATGVSRSLLVPQQHVLGYTGHQPGLLGLGQVCLAAGCGVVCSPHPHATPTGSVYGDRARDGAAACVNEHQLDLRTPPHAYVAWARELDVHYHTRCREGRRTCYQSRRRRPGALPQQ